MGSEILAQLGDWKTMLANGMHTFSEWLEDPRSECHSWSAYPAYYFLNTIAGICPATPHFKTVLIEPHMGNLKSVQARMPHPEGLIETTFQQLPSGKWQIAITLPATVPGTLKWKEKTYSLKAGQTNTLNL
jgi:hypothetical protein